MMLVWFLILFAKAIVSDDYTILTSSPRQRGHEWASRQNSIAGSPKTTENQLNSTGRNNYPSHIESRLSKLESVLFIGVERLRGEIQETSRRLQALEWQGMESHTQLENLRADLEKFADLVTNGDANGCTIDQTKLQNRTEFLSKGVQVLVTNMKLLNSDILGIKKNISFLASSTRKLLLLTERKSPDLIQRDDTFTSLSSPVGAYSIPRSCKDVQKRGNNSSGIYQIQPERSNTTFMVMCDLESVFGGWTVIHNRFDGTEDFYRNWDDYKRGFGNLAGEFWLGLEYIHLLTGYEVNELFVELEDLNHKRKYAHYGFFSVGPEADGYPLRVLGGYAGDAGDSLTFHAGCRFSTKDKDQDNWPEGSCAMSHKGAWWYRNCDTSNLNGRYLSGELPDLFIYQGMYWNEFRGPKYSLLKARLLIRPR